MQNKFILVLLFMAFLTQSKEEFVIPQSLLKQVEEGNADIAYFIADSFNSGTDDFKTNYDKAMFWYEKAANMGSPQAMMDFADKLDAKDDKLQALKWYKKAADAGMGEAMDAIALYYYRGYADLKKDCQVAYQWYEKAEAKQVELAYNNHAWYLVTSAEPECRNPERALKIIYDLIPIYDNKDAVPWNVWDTKAAVLAAVSDFGAAIKLQQWLIKELKSLDIDVKSYQTHLDNYLQRKVWIER